MIVGKDWLVSQTFHTMIIKSGMQSIIIQLPNTSIAVSAHHHAATAWHAF
jgi:hypothetical protein